MTFLSKLTITQLKRPTKSTPQEQRRNKLITKLEEQLALAEAQKAGKRYVVMKSAWTRDDNGNKQKVQREKIVRPWFWPDANGLCMVVKYGSTALELAKGKRALTVPSIDAVPDAITTVIAAVKAGELDTSIENSVANIDTNKGAVTSALSWVPCSLYERRPVSFCITMSPPQCRSCNWSAASTIDKIVLEVPTLKIF